MTKTAASSSPSSPSLLNNSTSSRRRTILLFFVGAVFVPFTAAIIPLIMGPNKHLSAQQRNQDTIFFFAVSFTAAVGLAAYLYYDHKRTIAGTNDDKPNEDTTKKATITKATDDDSSRPKDIWQVGNAKQNILKKPKAAYEGKKFGSSYYYAHNDSNTTGGYKDGLKMEDYRMNGPRLLSKNGLSVDGDNDGGGDNKKHGAVEKTTTTTTLTTESSAAAPTRITAQDSNVKNITKYMWDDPGNEKGIATIRVDVVPGDKFGEFLDWKDAGISNVVTSLPGEGLLAKIMVGTEQTPRYQLKIDKLYGDAADVKVILKPKRLLIKIYKKKHGFLSKNENNLDAWPQPHRKI